MHGSNEGSEVDQRRPDRSADEEAGGPVGVRRYAAEKLRSPRRTPQINILILIGIIALVVTTFFFLFFKRPELNTETFSLRRSIEKIEELSTVRSHLRFAVVVREESGNIVVRELAAAAGDIDMNDIGSFLFQDPTLIVELHAVATYGVRLDNIDQRIRPADEDEEVIRVDLPEAELLDVKVVNSDTRIIARMQGLIRSSNRELMLEAGRKGEEYATKEARADSSSLGLARTRAREIIRLLVESAGKGVEFEGEGGSNSNITGSGREE